MSEKLIIKSTKNQIIKQVKALSQKKERDEQGLFLVEGKRFVMEIPFDWTVRYCVLSESYFADNSSLLPDNIAVYVVCDHIFNAISDTKSPQGIIAVLEQRRYFNDFISYICSSKNFFVIIDQLNDPGNVGTIIRTADALGFDAVFLSEGTVDIYNTKVLRATMGSIFHLPIVSNVKLELLLPEMRQNNIRVIGTNLSANDYICDVDLSKSSALIIGNEAHGLSALTESYVDCLIKIPMIGNAESLNASVAASIVMYETMRQRRG